MFGLSPFREEEQGLLGKALVTTCDADPLTPRDWAMAAAGDANWEGSGSMYFDLGWSDVE